MQFTRKTDDASSRPDLATVVPSPIVGLTRRHLMVGAVALSSSAAWSQDASQDAVVLQEFTRDQLLAEPRFPRMRKMYKEWGVVLKTPLEQVLATVQASATKDGMTGILIKFKGTRREEHNGFGYLYNAVDAIGVRLVDPAPEQILESLKRAGHVYPLETEIAIHRAVETHLQDAAPILLDGAKSATNLDMLRAYAQIVGADASPELVKILRFHPNGGSRVAAADELARLGTTQPIQEAYDSEKDPQVRQALQRLLLR